MGSKLSRKQLILVRQTDSFLHSIKYTTYRCIVPFLCSDIRTLKIIFSKPLPFLQKIVYNVEWLKIRHGKDDTNA